jgi:hypothetical protein
VSPAELIDDIDTYLDDLENLSEDAEFVDLPTARRIAAQCRALLAHLNAESPEVDRRLIQASIRYFIEDEDAEADTDSPTGLDDDAEVVEVVARELGYESVIIAATEAE